MRECRKCTAWRIQDMFNEFFKEESAGGILLMVMALVAMGLANSPWGRLMSMRCISRWRFRFFRRCRCFIG